MKKIEQVYREILYQIMEKKNNTLTQKELSIKLKISLSTVNHALKKLENMSAIKINPRNFKIINYKKILYYWACVRNIKQDIIYETRLDKSVREIEQKMPFNTMFTAYSAFKFKFKDVPSDYSEVYVYINENDLEEIKKRFPKSEKISNLFVLKKDLNNKYDNLATIASIFVDLWNLKEWYAKDFLKALEEKINGILE